MDRKTHPIIDENIFENDLSASTELTGANSFVYQVVSTFSRFTYLTLRTS